MLRSLVSKGLSLICSSTSTMLVSKPASRRLRFRPGMLKGVARNARIEEVERSFRQDLVLNQDSGVH